MPELPRLDESEISRIVEMAWEDRTPFDAIEASHGLAEKDVIALMRREMKPGSFRLWRRRVTGRATKHGARRPAGVLRAHAPTQYKVRGRGRSPGRGGAKGGAKGGPRGGSGRSS